MTEQNTGLDLTEQFQEAWGVFMAQGIGALEEEEIAAILFHMHHVEEQDYTDEQRRFMDALSGHLQNQE